MKHALQRINARRVTKNPLNLCGLRNICISRFALQVSGL